MDALPPDAGASTLAEQALDSILRLIREGQMGPGATVNEVELARRFGMSRGPVREAVRRLQERKLVTRGPYLRARVVSLSLDELQQVFELRECIEGMACRLATQRLSSVAIDDMKHAVEQDMANGSPSFDFHLAVAQGSGNARIAALLSADLYDLVRLYYWRSGTVQLRRAEALDEHWQIATAMATRNAALAESLMRSHIQRAWKNLRAEAE